MSNFKIYQKWPKTDMGPKIDTPFIYFLNLTRMNLSTSLIHKTKLRPICYVLIGYDKEENKIYVKSASKQRNTLKISRHTSMAKKDTKNVIGNIHISGVLKFFNLKDIVTPILKTRIYPDIVRKGYFEFSLESLQPLLKKQNDTKTNTRKHQD